MRLLFCGDSWQGDDSHLDEFSRLSALIGHEVKTTMTARENAHEVAMLCQRHKIDAVISSQRSLLEAALRNTPDYIPPPGNKKVTLDDYAGSWIDLPYGIPLLVINPLERLNTVPYEKFILNRYISKLTKPDRWWKQTPFKWRQVTPENEAEVLKIIEAADLLATDIETSDSEGNRTISCVGYCAYNYASPQDSPCFVIHFNSEWAWRFVKRANKSKAQKIFQNGQYDNCYFARWNCLPINWVWDTLTLMHCWYSEFPKRLDFITSFALRRMRFWKDDGNTGSWEDLFRYNALDCWATLNSFLSMMQEIPQYVVTNYLEEFPMNFPAITAALEGWRVDVETFRKVRAGKEAAAEATLKRLRYILGAQSFNPRSWQQVFELFKLLGCGDLKGTGKAEMMKAKASSPLNELILSMVTDYREAMKLVSSYLDEGKLWNDRWYYLIQMAGTDTLRGASQSSPFWCGDNIQNIPRGDTIKQFFVSDPGWLLAEPDKEQSEARCVGYLAGETALIDLVESPRDYHAWNAQEFFGIPYAAIYDEAKKKVLDKEIRDLSKRTNHGANYNMGGGVMLDTMGPKKVAFAKVKLKLPAWMRLKSVCDYLLKRYEETYPRVKGLYYDSIITAIATTNKLVSPLGWTRYFFAKPSRKNKPALNAAVAHPSQNLSVHIINKEWYAIWRETIYGSLRGLVRIKAQIHDSLPFQYRPGFDPAIVQRMMNTKVEVKGADGVTRTMLIPTALKSGDTRWANLE
jgi:hypothetical protein